MTTLDEHTVRHVAKLARLKLSDEEVRAFQEQLTAIMDHFALLDEVDTTGVEPTAHALAIDNVLRDDVVQAPLPTEQTLRNTPARHGDHFQVPKVLNQESS